MWTCTDNLFVMQIGHLKIKCRLAAGGGGDNRGGGGSGGGECHTCGGFGHRECSCTMMTYIRHLPQFITRLPCDESVCMCVFVSIFQGAVCMCVFVGIVGAYGRT